MIRDSLATGIGINFDYKRYIEQSDLVDVDGRTHLSLRDKASDSICEIFEDRAKLHKKAGSFIINFLISANLLKNSLNLNI